MTTKHSTLVGTDLHLGLTRLGSGVPSGVTPSIAGEMYKDTSSGLFYVSNSATTGDWSVCAATAPAASGIVVANNVTNASWVSGITPASSVPSVSNLQACTATFAAPGTMLFSLQDGLTGDSILVTGSYAKAGMSAISDPNNLFLVSDAGTGYYIHKSANSFVVTVKNRSGSTTNITLQVLIGGITSATAWS